MDKIETPKPGTFLAHAEAQAYADFVTPVPKPRPNPKYDKAKFHPENPDTWPFLKSSGKRARLENWPMHRMTDDEVARYDVAGYGAGLVARNACDGTFALWAVDADEDDQTASDALLARFVEWFREQAIPTIYIRRAGNYPRFALLLRIPEAFTAKPPKRGACEFGSAGWQLASLGQHPNGEWRTWYRIDTATGACEAQPGLPACADLPSLTKAECDELMELCGPANSSAGRGKRHAGPIPRLAVEGDHRGQIAAQPLPPAQQKALAAPRAAAVRLILAALPNVTDERDPWIGESIVIIGALRNLPEAEARELTLDWFGKLDRSDPAEDEKVFEELWSKRERIMVGYPDLLNMVKPVLGGHQGLRDLGLTTEDTLILDAFGPEPGKPVVRFRAAELDDTVAEICDALAATGAPVYAQEGRLVSPHQAVATGEAGKIHLADITTDWMRLLVSRHLIVERLDRRGEKWQRISLSKETAGLLLTPTAQERFARIRGLLECPSLREDGSLLDRQGFDPATGYFLIREAPDVRVPDVPTQQEAQAALVLLRSPFSETAFADTAGESVAIAGILHTCARALMDVVPMVAITSPSPRSGKGYTLAMITAPAIGRRVESVGATRDRKDFDKRLEAVLLAGAPAINLDNSVLPLDTALLAQAIENPRVAIRLMTTHKLVTVNNGYSIFANGNNLRISGDIPPRTLMIRLDPQLERPENRAFARDPLADVLKDRGRYISAALTVVRWWMQARERQKGAPSPPALAQLRPLASFGQWSAIAREPLIVLGMPDPCDTQAIIRATSDEAADEAEAVFAIFHDATGGKPHSAHELTTIVADLDRGQCAQVLAVAAHQARPHVADHVKLGYWLRDHKDQIRGGITLSALKPTNKALPSQWVFSKKSGNAPPPPAAGAAEDVV